MHKWGNEHPGRYHKVYYENLLYKPQEKLEEIYRFLDLESNYPEIKDQFFFDTTNIHKWGNELNYDEKSLLERWLKPYEPGYFNEASPEKPRLSFIVQNYWQAIKKPDVLKSIKPPHLLSYPYRVKQQLRFL